MTKEQIKVGQRVISCREMSDVPIGSKGEITRFWGEWIEITFENGAKGLFSHRELEELEWCKIAGDDETFISQYSLE